MVAMESTSRILFVKVPATPPNIPIQTEVEITTVLLLDWLGSESASLLLTLPFCRSRPQIVLTLLLIRQPTLTDKYH